MNNIKKVFTSLFITIFLCTAFSMQAEVFTVNSTKDNDNGSCDLSHCTLREAINAANGNGDGTDDFIEFDIPGPGPHVIKPKTVYDDLAGRVHIDGSTQPGGALSVELNGSKLRGKDCGGPESPTPTQLTTFKFVEVEHVSVIGLKITDFCIAIRLDTVNHAAVKDNFFLDNTGNAMILGDESNYVVIKDNQFITTPGKESDGLEFNGGSFDETALGIQHYLIKGNLFSGGVDAIHVRGPVGRWSGSLRPPHFGTCFDIEISENIIENQSLKGILFGHCWDSVVKNNIIRDIGRTFSYKEDGVEARNAEKYGMFLVGTKVSDRVDDEGNFLGDNVLVEGNHVSKVRVAAIAFTHIFGDAGAIGWTVRDNVIKDSLNSGILVGPGFAFSNLLTENLISSVGTIGIDLSDSFEDPVCPKDFPTRCIVVGDGITENDSGLGANGGQNYPVLNGHLSSWSKNDRIKIEGILEGSIGVEPKTSYLVECFANDSAIREAQVFLGSTTVKTNANSFANLTLTAINGDPLGDGSEAIYVSCTATNMENNNTSELSAPVFVQK